MKRMFDTARYSFQPWNSASIINNGAFGYRDANGNMVWDNTKNLTLYRVKPSSQCPYEKGIGYDLQNITVSFPTAPTAKPDYIVLETYNAAYYNDRSPFTYINRNTDINTPLIVASDTGVHILHRWGGGNAMELKNVSSGQMNSELYDYIQQAKGYIDEPLGAEEDEAFLMIPSDKFDFANGKITLHKDALPAEFWFHPQLVCAVIPADVLQA